MAKNGVRRKSAALLRGFTKPDGRATFRQFSGNGIIHLYVSRENMAIILKLITAMTLIMFAWPSDALANAGLPMLVLAWPGMFISLIPIVILESWYLHSRLKIPFSRSTKIMTIANLESTIIGIPLAWAAMLALEIGMGLIISSLPFTHTLYNNTFASVIMTFFSAAWIAPDDKHAYWMVPLAFIVLMVPFFFATWWIEYRSVKKQMKDVDFSEIKTTTRNLNLLSYGLLVLLLSIWLIVALIKGHK
ncbi:MAG: hypothetical protein C4550_00425 [Nitrospiraceae bacterium]|nr:MAG: hypothetical protein C4550_00425 [Nitrospiraceae bacterium]